MRYVLFGSGEYGKRALRFMGNENVKMFVDNDISKDGLKINNIEICYFDSVKEELKKENIIISVAHDKREQIEAQLHNYNIENYVYIEDYMVEAIKQKVLMRPDYIGIYNRAIAWIKNNSIPNEGVVVASTINKSYPEVTGYFIPSLIKWGYRDLAQDYANWLCNIQKEDGSWFDADDVEAYIFDSAQILKGLIAIRDIDSHVDENIIKGCEWILSRMDDEGRLVTPSKEAWGENRDMCDEIIHLYCISPLIEAGKIFNRNDYIEKANKIKEYYLNAYSHKIKNFSLLSHFYAYVMEALVDLGEEEKALAAMNNIATYQDENGAVPGYNNVNWVCSTGLFQLALVWFRLGDSIRGNKAFDYACKLQNSSGGWFGSYLNEDNIKENNDYFPDGEISWANKYFLDALYYKNVCEFNNQSQEFLNEIDKNDGRYIFIKNIAQKYTSVGSSVLDIGCGKGRYIRNLSIDLPDRKYYAVDLSEKVLRNIRIDNVICRQGNITSIPFGDNYFDFVYCCEALEHSIDVKNAIKEMVRVTRKGGKIAIVDKCIDRLGVMEIGEWEQWFDTNSLKKIIEEYCEDINIDKNIIYENKQDGLFFACVGTVS